jgi:hypothetical protein
MRRWHSASCSPRPSKACAIDFEGEFRLPVLRIGVAFYALFRSAKRVYSAQPGNCELG